MLIKNTILVIIFALFLFLPLNIKAQEPTGDIFDFNKAYQDFIFSFDNYRTDHSSYELARAQYLQSKTLTAKSKAQEATYKLLVSRDEVVRNYITALRLRLSEAEGISNDRLQILYSRIDIEVAFFEDHKENLSSASSLEDLVQDSKVAADRYRKFSEPLIYEILSEINIGKQYFLRQKQLSIIEELNTKLGEIRQSGDTSVSVSAIERWLLDTQNFISRSEAKETEVQEIKADLEKAKSVVPNYNQIIFRLKEGVQLLKDANSYLREILNKLTE